MTINPKFLQEYVGLASGRPVSGESKARFLALGKMVLRELASRMGLAPGTFEVRANKGGPGISGEAILHGERVYVTLGQNCLGAELGFMYRACRGRDDLKGLQNEWMQWDQLLDLDKAALVLEAESQKARW
jgi:hypothetical protein